MGIAMSFDVRCPKCRAKLRLDEAPEVGSPIECPKCERTFPAPADSVPPPASAPAPAPEAPKKKKKEKEEAKKREFINPFKLFAMVGGAMLGLILLLGTFQYFLYLAGSAVEESLGQIPPEYNYLRGINVKQMKKFPGFKEEMDKYYTKDVKDAFEKLAGATGRDPETLLTHLVMASTFGKSAPIYYFSTKSSVDRNFARGIEKAREESSGGVSFYRLPSSDNPILSGATVYCPTTRLIVVVPAGVDSSAVLRGTRDIARSERTTARIGNAGRMAVRAHMWQIVRNVESMQSMPVTLYTNVLVKALPDIAKNGANSTCLSVWISIGGSGVRLGAAMECTDKQAAESLVKSMQNGPLGKADDSRVPHQLKQAVPMSSYDRAFPEFLQYVEFDNKRAAAYFRTLVSGENAKQLVPHFSVPISDWRDTPPKD